MVKTTYGIKFQYANSMPLVEEVKQSIKEYEKNISLKNNAQAAEMAVQIAELLFEQCEEIDSTLSEQARSRIEKDSLKKSLQYSEKALVELRASQNKEQQARALMNMSKCYHKLCEYVPAILKNKEALKLYQEYHESDKYILQVGFKLLGDIYFSKGISMDAAAFDDFSNAYKFYEKEHCVIKTMTEKDVDGDPIALTRLSISSHCNMGIIGSKLPEYKKRASESFTKALKKAQTLDLYDSLKEIYWETAKVYARRDEYETVKKCQEMEYSLAIKHNKKDDEVNCLLEKIKTHLELEEYPDCYALWNTMKKTIDSEDESICQETFTMISTIESLKHTLYKTLALPRSSVSIFRSARLYLDVGQTQWDYGLNRAALRAANHGLESLENVEKKGSLCIIYASLFELKATVQWELRESEQNDYLSLNEGLLEYISTNIEKRKVKLDCSIPVYERLAAIYKYFKQKETAKHWDSVLTTAEKEFEEFSDAEDDEDDPMDVDTPDTPNNIMRVMSLEMSNKLLKSNTKDVRIRVLLPEPVTILVQVRSSGMTCANIMSEASKRTWELHGIEPRIGHLSVDDAQVSPDDLLDNIIKGPDGIIEAHVRGIVERPPIDCYQNACVRLKITPSPLITSRLHQQRTGTLNLSGLEITNNQLASIHELLFLTPVITRLDLSSNLLYDEDLKLLFKDIKSPRELILSNNRLTVESISTLLEMKNQSLKTLGLSYNPLGPSILLELPMLFKTFKKLEVLEMEGADLGHPLELGSTLHYDDVSEEADQINANRKVCINIRNNHFQGSMLSEWTSKWKLLPGIEALQLSGVTSDEKWEGFNQLSNFKWLKSLDFSRTVKGVLNIQALSSLFMLGSNLHHLDLSYCDLVGHDINLLCEGLEFDLGLESLILKSNPQLGDKAIQKLENSDLRRLTFLNISDCGVTNKSIDTIVQWIMNSKFHEVDVSGNDELIQNRRQLVHLIDHYPRERMFIFKISLDKDISLHDLDLPTGVKIPKPLIEKMDPFV